jgi:hypothetical protein
MNRFPDHRRLFDDALADDAPANFRDAQLKQTLRGARRRRRWRQTRRGMGALVLIGVAALLLPFFKPHQSPTLPALTSGFETVRTRPLPPGALVTTRPLSTEQLITSATATTVCQTPAAGTEYQEVNDDELVALALPRPAVLLHFGDHEARLIFIDPGNQNRFRAN